MGEVFRLAYRNDMNSPVWKDERSLERTPLRVRLLPRAARLKARMVKERARIAQWRPKKVPHVPEEERR